MSKKLLLVGVAIALLLGFTSQARAYTGDNGGELVFATFTLVDELGNALDPQPNWASPDDPNYDNMMFGLSGYPVHEQPPRNPAGELVEMGLDYPIGGEHSTIWYYLNRADSPSADENGWVTVGVVDADGIISDNLVVFTTTATYPANEGNVTRLVLTTEPTGEDPDPPDPPDPSGTCDEIKDFLNTHVHDKGSGARTTGPPTAVLEAIAGLEDVVDAINTHTHDKGSSQRTTGAPSVPME